MINLCEKYRPSTIADIIGQSDATQTIGAFLSDPYPCAFLFSGDSGTGKTSAAISLANGLGVSSDNDELGGMNTIASGEQTSDSIRAIVNRLSFYPMYGSGWKVLIVNECDRMHMQAETIWLDVLENIPPHTVIVFTTNNPDELSDRFIDRCNHVQFTSSISTTILGDYARRLAKLETGEDVNPRIKVDAIIKNGRASIRRLVNEVQRCILTKDYR